MKKVYIRHKIQPGEIQDISDKESLIILSDKKDHIEELIQVIATNGTFLGQIVFVDKNNVEVEILKELNKNTEIFSISLIQGVIREEKMKYCIEKSIELGINEIYPAITSLSSRTISNCNKYYNNWVGYKNEAIKQSLRQSEVIINKANNLTSIDLKSHANSFKICFTTENIKAKKISEILKNQTGKYLSYVIAVGPEKGFSPQDINYFNRNNFIFASLGDSIIRSETVSPVAAGIIKFVNNKL